MANNDERIRLYMGRINRWTMQLLDARLQPYNITHQQALLIRFVTYTQREKGEAICQKDIEEAFERTGAAITSLLQGLERKGFITRRPDPTDERKKLVIPLHKAIELMQEFDEAFQEMDEKLTHSLNPEQQEALIQMLELIMQDLEK
ncbi:MarR family transcriptional regulator [Ktedonosporobacter rubrisoli]|uniref:MarR family transcriptional regulator n=1 Tax=Ktedonosporobacter rubrisoli TaxID=2509675 RepID=A0A4V0YY33_KTERU|nr:MarR family transcriptional regulator [Ktedonosporobacter rubrisoli]QBD74821.1 MarR family transcriptional regulator [Ktedonosporobacter rubrisoli]